MNREERRQLANRIRRGIATDKELELARAIGPGRTAGPARWPTRLYYVMPDGSVGPVAGAGARLLRRSERRRLVGIRAWREGSRAPRYVQ